MSYEDKKKCEMYENALFGILQGEGEIVPFLDTIFKFLYRRTDFFRVQHNEGEKLGFPPKMAEKLVIATVRKYAKMAYDDETRLNPPVEKSPPIEQTVRGTPEGSDVPDAKSEQVCAAPNDSLEEPAKKESDDEPARERDEESKPCDGAESEEEQPEDEETKHLKKQQTVFQGLSQSYNGAVRDNFSWSQSITDVDVMVKVPENVTKGNQVVVDIKHTHVTVKTKEGGELKELVDGELCWKINVENSCWTLIPGEAVHINLEKVQERWWDSLLIGEPKINVRNIDACRPMSDLGEEEQAKIEELMFNEHQKRLGKPTVEQLKVEKILKDAWNMDGSPFKGQPFDLSTINIAASGNNAPCVGQQPPQL